MKKNKAKLWIISASGILLCCAVVVFFNLFNTEEPYDNSTLTSEQIEQLREKYPIYGKILPPNMSFESASVEDVREISDSYIYGEVIGEMSAYSKSVPLKNKEQNEKRAKYGISSNIDFYEYPIRVISDTEKEFSKGEIIKITSNYAFIDYNPKLSKGMKVVVPVTKEDGDSSRCGYSVEGMYYVTDDGYVLAAFDEEEVPTPKNMLSGIRVENLLKALKK